MIRSNKQPGRHGGYSSNVSGYSRDPLTAFPRPKTLLIVLYGVSIVLMGFGIFRGEFWETWQNGATL